MPKLMCEMPCIDRLIDLIRKRICSSGHNDHVPIGLIHGIHDDRTCEALTIKCGIRVWACCRIRVANDKDVQGAQVEGHVQTRIGKRCTRRSRGE